VAPTELSALNYQLSTIRELPAFSLPRGETTPKEGSYFF